MAYERDPDRLIKGVGAIAARDAGNSHRRQLRMAQAARTRKRDRALSGVTFGPRGGLRGPLDMGLGYTPTLSQDGGGGGSGKGTAAKGVSATFVGAASNTKLYGGSGGTPVTTLNTNPNTGTTTTFVGQKGSGTLVTFPGTIPATTSGGITLELPPGTTGVGVTGGASSGGGGGAGITLEPPPSTVPPVVELPPFEVPPDGSAVDNTTRNLMIVGGVALAAWLYFRNRGGS